MLDMHERQSTGVKLHYMGALYIGGRASCSDFVDMQHECTCSIRPHVSEIIPDRLSQLDTFPNERLPHLFWQSVCPGCLDARPGHFDITFPDMWRR